MINHPNDEPYTRVIEHAHFADQHCGVTTLTYEYPEAHQPGSNEPFYPVPCPDSHRRFNLYAAESALLSGKVFFAGRLAEYRYYDMDQAIAHALALVEHKIRPYLPVHDRFNPILRPPAPGLVLQVTN